MNKETFLNELSERLHVLNEKERQDVLEEYAQHIDLKIQNGQSEEDAVHDFGTPEELCEELLDAYHINAAYAAGTIPNPAAADWKNNIRDVLKRIQKEKEEDSTVDTSKQIHFQESCQKKAQRQEERRIKREAWLADWKRKYAEKKERKRLRKEDFKKYMAVLRENHRQKRQERLQRRMQRGGTWIGRMFGRTVSMISTLCLWCWKCCLFLAAAPFLFMTLSMLFCTGIVVVWLWKGYPFLGMTLIGLGGFLMSAGISGLLLTYVFVGNGMRKRSAETADDNRKSCQTETMKNHQEEAS